MYYELDNQYTINNLQLQNKAKNRKQESMLSAKREQHMINQMLLQYSFRILWSQSGGETKRRAAGREL